MSSIQSASKDCTWWERRESNTSDGLDAAVSPDLIRVLRNMACERNPAILAVEDGVEPQPVEVPIEKIPKYERLAPVSKRMRDNGAPDGSLRRPDFTIPIETPDGPGELY
jgi:hypothetical protein